MQYSRTLNNHNHIVNTLFYYPDWVDILYEKKTFVYNWSPKTFLFIKHCTNPGAIGYDTNKGISVVCLLMSLPLYALRETNLPCGYHVDWYYV